MMKAVSISETSVYFYKTARRYMPEACHLQSDAHCACYTLVHTTICSRKKLLRRVTSFVDLNFVAEGYHHVLRRFELVCGQLSVWLRNYQHQNTEYLIS
jgi:hypothetical protein